MTEEESKLFDQWYAENYDEWAEGEEGIALREELKQAFLAGLHEGQPKWHDLREDPNDLPKRIGNVVQNQDGDKVTYDYRLKKWRWLDGCDNGLEMVAWCETPTFKE